jgi:hypothetical protein
MKFEENINYMGWPGCIRLSNQEIEMVVASLFGPRILHFGFINGNNLFYLSDEDRGKSGGKDWRIFGGHRLWLAPENIPFTYVPDNDRIDYFFSESRLTITGMREELTQIIKEIEISFVEGQNRVNILHRVLNKSDHPVELSVWAISAMAPGGTAIVPQEPYGEGNNFLLPCRSMALWQYTDMKDPRWIWGRKYIQAIQDISRTSEQKIGIMNRQGWAAYVLNEDILITQFGHNPLATYPDYGSNNEIYICGQFLEIETLGPLEVLLPEGVTETSESWSLHKGRIPADETGIDEFILPLLIDRNSANSQKFAT